jgi:hypothetical protein
LPPGEIRITDDLDLLLAVMPPPVRAALESRAGLDELLEVVLDLGRPPEARFPGRVQDLASEPVSRHDLAHVVARVGRFAKDNRAGIERTLHRISALRNRVGGVIGFTCRIGRAVYGTVAFVRDVIEAGRSKLLLGRPPAFSFAPRGCDTLCRLATANRRCAARPSRTMRCWRSWAAAAWGWCTRPSTRACAATWRSSFCPPS